MSLPNNPKRVTVIGGGVAGLTTAVALAERGAAVTLIEKSAAPLAEACSRMAGGMLAPFCERERGEPQVAEWGMEALAWWRDHVPEMSCRGSLVLASPGDRAALDRFAARTEGYERLTPERLGALEPDLAGRSGGALFFADEGHLDPRGALLALIDRLKALGAELRFGEVADDTDMLDADAVVDARGLLARDRLDDLRGVKGEMLVLRAPELSISRPVRLLHPRFPVYIVPRPAEVYGAGTYMVGATMIEADDRNRITARSMAELIAAACALHPAFADAEVVETGAEARPSFPDNLPHIRRDGPSGRRITYVNGFNRHGFLAAPALARMAASAVLDGAVFPEVMDREEVDACI